jgi:hypothetical protein
MHWSEFHEGLIHLNTKCFVLPLQLRTGPSKLFKIPEIVSPPPTLGGLHFTKVTLHPPFPVHYM